MLQVTSRALQRLHRSEPDSGSMERHDSMTSALCTVLELSSLSNCESDVTSVSVDSDVNMSRPRNSFESSRLAQPVKETTSCPLPRCESDVSMELMASRRSPTSAEEQSQ